MGPKRRPRTPLPLVAWFVVVTLVATLGAGCGTSPAPDAGQDGGFAVSDLSIESDGRGIEPGDEVMITAVVRNLGDVEGTFAADLTVDGSTTAHEDVALPAGQSEIVRFRISAGAPGDHDVRLADAVANLHVANVAAAAFSISNLAIESSGSEIEPGDAVGVTATVRNTGEAAGTFDANLTVDGAVEAREDVALEAGESQVVRFRLVAGEAGDHSVALGDARTPLVVLGPAAFELTSLAVDPNPAETGDRLRVQVGLTNVGGLTGTHTVRLTIDGKAAGSKESTLAGGDETTLLFSVKSPSAGRHTLAAGGLEARLVVWRIERPANGKVLVNKIKGGMGRLKIKNGGDLDGFVVLARTSAPTKTLLAVYVRAGKSATIGGIKNGNYIMYFSRGKRWDGSSRSFTSDQELRRFEDPIRFKTTRVSGGIRYTIWTVSLIAVVGGNAPTEPVDEGAFPGMP